ncbi:MAG: phage antirepressor N-terminal domain-containing protein [Chloroflexota bacterium]
MGKETKKIVSLGEVSIPFHEHNIIVQLGENGNIYVAMRPLVESIGLDWSAQYRRIQRDNVLQKHMVTCVAVTATQGRELVCLPKEFVVGFLFGINTNRIKDPLVRENIDRFREEAHLFLDAAFTGDEESAMQAIRMRYRKQGYDNSWIERRLINIQIRNDLTEEWKGRGIQNRQYGILTAVIHRGAFGMNPSDHKTLKGVTRDNVRDHMTGIELAFSSLAEAATLDNIKEADAQGYSQNLTAAEKGGNAAGDARRAFEKTHGRKVISDKSYLEERKRLASDAKEDE